jgi:uncharacterized phosphosugar-binding protein
MTPVSTYFHRLSELLEALQRDEAENILKAAALCKRQIEQDGLIHVFGVGGHSAIGCEEFFWRAGGLANISPIFDLSLLLSGGGKKSTLLERTPGIGDKVIAARELGEKDLLVITSIYGMNAATIDAALEARRRGTTIIAITSVDYSTQTPADFPARHPSRKNLSELAHVTIDNHVPYGDVLTEVPGFAQGVGSASTILVSACIQWLVIETVIQCKAAGIEAPIWQGANTVGGDENNARHTARYLSRVKAL